jgi:hypothetical protein
VKDKSRRAADVFVNARTRRLITALKRSKHKDQLVVVMLDERKKQTTILLEPAEAKNGFGSLAVVGEIVKWIIEIGLLIASSNITISTTIRETD